MAEQQAKLTVPKTLDFTEQDIVDSSARVKIAHPGCYLAVLGGCENSISQKSWWPMFVLNWWPLADENKPDTAQKSLSMKSYHVLPFVTDDVRRRYSPAELTIKKSQYTDMIARNLRAIFGEEIIPPYPYFDKDQKVYTWNGGTLSSKEDADTVRKDINRSAYKLAQELWADSNKWVTPNYRGAYLTVSINDRGFPEVGGVYPSKPDDVNMVPFEKWFEEAA